MNHKQAIVTALNALAELPGSRETTRQRVDTYAIGLDGFTPEQIKVATAHAIKTCKFMPAPSELREFATLGGEDPESRAIKAWGALGLAVMGLGYTRSADFDDPLINACVRHLGGWQSICQLPVAQFDTWLRKEFLKVYVTFAKRPPSAEACKPLMGWHAETNGTHHRHDRLEHVATELDSTAMQPKPMREMNQPAIPSNIPRPTMKELPR